MVDLPTEPWHEIRHSVLAAVNGEGLQEPPAYPRPRQSFLPWFLNPLCLVFLGLVYAYRLFYPKRMRRVCIYTPSCSLYAVMALKCYGVFHGARLALRRIRRCDGSLYRGGPDIP